MKNKIILAVLCVVLLLLLTSLSYAGWGNLKPRPLEPKVDQPLKHQKAQLLKDPPPRDLGGPDLGDPWDHMLSPRISDDGNVQVEVSVFLFPFNFDAPMVLRISKNLSIDVPDNKDVGH